MYKEILVKIFTVSPDIPPGITSEIRPEIL